MSDYLYKIMALAAKSDGDVDTEEKLFLKNYFKYNLELSAMTQEQKDLAKVELASKNEGQIINELAKNLSEEEKQKAYAMAMEVCAINYEILPLESTFLNKLKKKWNIQEEIDNSLVTSRKLRYGF